MNGRGSSSLGRLKAVALVTGVAVVVEGNPDDLSFRSICSSLILLVCSRLWKRAMKGKAEDEREMEMERKKGAEDDDVHKESGNDQEIVEVKDNDDEGDEDEEDESLRGGPHVHTVEDDDGEDEDGDGDEKDEDGDGGEGGDDDDVDDEDNDEHEVLGGDKIALEDDIRKEMKNFDRVKAIYGVDREGSNNHHPYDLSAYENFKSISILSCQIDSLYQGGLWKLLVELPDDYPYKPSSIRFINKIYHPNFHEVSIQ